MRKQVLVLALMLDLALVGWLWWSGAFVEGALEHYQSIARALIRYAAPLAVPVIIVLLVVFASRREQ